MGPKETWTHTFVCIAESDQWLIPSREEKIILKEAGLGEKRITFDKYGDYEHFHSSLLKEFPKLSEGGGLQVLRSSGARRSLDLIPVPTMGYDIPYLEDCLGQAIAYVRPLPCIRSPVKNPASLAKPGQAGLSGFFAKLTRKMRPGKAWQAWLNPSFLGNLGHKSPAFSAVLIPRPDFLDGIGQKQSLASLATLLLA